MGVKFNGFIDYGMVWRWGEGGVERKRRNM